MADQQPPDRASPFRGASNPAITLDAPYVARIGNRSQLLVRESARTKEEIFRTRRELARVQDDLRREIASIRTELDLLRKESDRTVRRVETMVEEFRRLARANEYARLRERVDAWAPEARITREQFTQMLRDA